MSRSPSVPTYGMQERSERADFHIREKSHDNAEPAPHRHEYFQIQINLGADTTQRIGNVERPFPRHGLAFILPHRIHYIPASQGGHFLLVNFDQSFLAPQLTCSPLDLEEVSVELAPELAPFLVQQHLDFVAHGEAWEEVAQLLNKMQAQDNDRGFGAREYLRGCVLQLIGLVCRNYAQALLELSSSNAAQTGRRDALKRMTEYVRQHLADPDLNLKTTAAATYLSPNYLTHWLRRETGKTFSELVLERRMHLARTLLTTTRRPVGEVASLCGFADEAYFSRRFRQTHGIAPGQFRKRELGIGCG